MLQFQPPEFNIPTDLRVQKVIIDSPFGVNGQIGAALRIVGRLQPKDLEEVGLVAVNTYDRTCIGKIETFVTEIKQEHAWQLP